jgi:hypothetical protein
VTSMCLSSSRNYEKCLCSLSTVKIPFVSIPNPSWGFIQLQWSWSTNRGRRCVKLFNWPEQSSSLLLWILLRVLLLLLLLSLSWLLFKVRNRNLTLHTFIYPTSPLLTTCPHHLECADYLAHLDHLSFLFLQESIGRAGSGQWQNDEWQVQSEGGDTSRSASINRGVSGSVEGIERWESGAEGGPSTPQSEAPTPQATRKSSLGSVARQ